MIKRIVGIIVAQGAIVVMVLAALHRERFSPLVSDGDKSGVAVEVSSR